MSNPNFLPPQSGEMPEIDRVGAMPHPREMLSLVGQQAAERAFLSLYTSGRLHHAFLLTGPEGCGKATFAYRAARFLLAEAEREGDAMFGTTPQDLAVSAGSRTAQLVANLAHSDLGVLKRRYDPKTKKFRSEIGVDDMREALSLFEKTAAFDGWRVIIVDAADDLNNASANALLKTLEEPPEKAVFFLVAHQPQKLLPTIRSRCRTLAFNPLQASDLDRLAEMLTGRRLDPDARTRAQGSMRRALRLGDPGFRAYLAQIDDVLGALPKRQHSQIDRIAEACRAGADGEQALADFLEVIEAFVHVRMQALVASGHLLAANSLAEFWSGMQENAARLDAVNLDRRAFVTLLVDELAGLMRG